MPTPVFGTLRQNPRLDHPIRSQTTRNPHQITVRVPKLPRTACPSYTNMTFLFLPKREQQIAPPLDMDALQKALGSVALHCAAFNNAELHRNLPRQSLTPTPTSTPPPDHDSNIAKCRELEKHARKHLSKDGCPPCYPADLGFPLQDIPDDYEGIILYWRSLPGTGAMGELHAQYSDWKSFRCYQEKIRRYHLHRQTFHVYLEEARDRFRRHGLEEYSCLQSDRQQQNGLNFRTIILRSLRASKRISGTTGEN